jgi:hypothetical protein
MKSFLAVQCGIQACHRVRVADHVVVFDAQQLQRVCDAHRSGDCGLHERSCNTGNFGDPDQNPTEESFTRLDGAVPRRHGQMDTATGECRDRLPQKTSRGVPTLNTPVFVLPIHDVFSNWFSTYHVSDHQYRHVSYLNIYADSGTCHRIKGLKTHRT